MKKKNLFLEITKSISEMIKSFEYTCEVRVKPNYFTRKGKIGFENMILLMLNFLKRTLTIELDNYFKNVLGSQKRVSKQAFSKGRQKISHEAFVLMIEKQIKKIYTATNLNTYKGYRLTGIDATTLELENTKELREAFGCSKNRTTQVARARVSGLFDIENNIMIDAVIDNYDSSEREFAKKHIENLIKYGLKNDLMLFDRGYPSKKLISILTDAGINFVMRVSTSFLKEINELKGDDEEITFEYNSKYYKIRIVKFMLDSGEEEVLLTSILDKSFTISDLKELYFKRWGLEVKYNELKHRLQVENLSGKTPIAVKQDFYATIFLQNMAALAKMQSDDEIHEKNEEKELKYEYQTNVNILVGKLKDKMVLMLMSKSERNRQKLFNNIMYEIAHNIVPIRPDRHNERKFKSTINRYPMNARKSL